MTRQREIHAELTSNSVAGYWTIIAYPAGRPNRDVSIIRGAPIQIGEFSFTDPLGAASMTLTLPQVTIFDKLGYGELDWLVKHTDVDVIWTGDSPLPAAYPQGTWGPEPWPPGDARPGGPRPNVYTPQWSWEGYIVSFEMDSSAGLTVQLKGAGLQLDNWDAKPEYAARPLPYEYAIMRQFLQKSSLRLHPLKIVWPSWWTTTYKAPVKGTPSYLIPVGVSVGDKWTGMVTRSTGTWDPVLTSYIQSLLSSMYTNRGRWVLDFFKGRQPYLFHRDFTMAPGLSTVEIDPAAPGVKMTFNEDWEQALTTIYGQGTSLEGVTFTGMDVSGNGQITTYEPLAATRQVFPDAIQNHWHDRNRMVKETQIQMQQGLSEDDAAIVARAHLMRFAEPGQTGTITLDSDPKINGVLVPRHLIRAGFDVHVPYVLGRPEGVLAHVSSSTHSIASGTTTLTVDTKHRDALTTEEVRLRGRDSLSINRMLLAGQYKPVIPDQLYPWSYAAGSGFIPSNRLFNSRPLLSAVPNDVHFPWESWTIAHPPKSARWKNSYLKIGSVNANANNNWITQFSDGYGSAMGIPILMAQAGTIRLLQFAAYDINGHVLKIPFHISFYSIGGVNVKSMPLIPAQYKNSWPPYTTGQHYPFVKDGWEAYNADGTHGNPKIPHPTESVGLIRAYGTYYDKAGYWPGASSSGDLPTGLLVDESSWDWDISSVAASTMDVHVISRNLTNKKAGHIYAMIFCDQQFISEDRCAYFMGRMFRVEPGAGV